MFETTPINQQLKKTDPFNDSGLKPKQFSILQKRWDATEMQAKENVQSLLTNLTEKKKSNY